MVIIFVLVHVHVGSSPVGVLIISAMLYGLHHWLTPVLFNEYNNSIIPRYIFLIGYVRANYIFIYYYSSISKVTMSMQSIFPFSSYHPAQLTHYPFPLSAAGRL